MDAWPKKLEFATKAEVDAEAVERVATFHGFARLALWFGVHAIIDVFGVIFLLVGHLFLGLILIAVGTTVLVSAVCLSVRESRREHQTTLPAGSGQKPTNLRPVEARSMPPGLAGA
jgi:hypothetical protein